MQSDPQCKLADIKRNIRNKGSLNPLQKQSHIFPTLNGKHNNENIKEKQ